MEYRKELDSIISEEAFGVPIRWVLKKELYCGSGA
jgi:hypothetical protein